MSDRAREVVELLLEKLVSGELESDPGAVTALFAEDVEYLGGPGMELVVGRPGLEAEFARQLKTYSDLSITTSLIASDGSTVTTERVDEFTLTHNGVRAANPLLAVFEVNDDGLITAWREYWDALSLGKAISA